MGNWIILIFGVSEATKTLDVGGRHLGKWDIQCRHCEDDEEESKLGDIWTTTIVFGPVVCMCPH